MPTQQGIVGPIPPGQDPEEYDKLRRRVLWKMPSGLYVLGSRAGERRNGMTINWVTQLSFDPKLVGVSVEREAFTHELVADGGVFSVNLVAQDDRAIVRKFTKPVEVEGMTANGFAFSDAPVTGCPVLETAVAYVDCRLWKTVDVGTSTLFIGEVVDAGFQKAEDTPVLRMEDTRMNYGG